MKDETPYGDKRFVDWQSENLRKASIGSALVFLVSYLILFLGMSRKPNIYDEGLVVTAAMRVSVGQIPHRDFYANYGPAQFYILAGLFKVFGESLLVERLFDLFIKALLVTLVYAILASRCRKSVAACASVVTIVWLLAVTDLVGTPVIPVSLLNLVGSVIILPIFLRRPSTRRMFAAGAVAGLAGLFRYDTGVALFGVQVCTLALATYFGDATSRLRNFASALWPLLLGFAAVTLPAALCFLSVAPIQPFVHDMIVYPSRYYRRSRNLPFPGIHRKTLENLEIYLPIVLAGVSLYLALTPRSAAQSKNSLRLRDLTENQKWRGFLVTFGLLAGIMYLKGLVRVSLAHMYLSIVPSLLLIAVLYEHRSAFGRLGRISIISLAWLSLVAATWEALDEGKALYHQMAVPFSASRYPPEVQMWCKTANPLTMGFCFLPEDNRIRTIEFIDSHSRPDQQLYVGTTRHDRIYENDNIIYFAARRLPATHWSHFDPGLQNSYVIQEQMVHDLEINAPPYIVLDSEFDHRREPNDSAKSTGVTLLDEYIHKTYQQTQSFGDLSIWQRTD
jgi:hypothetical protein